MQRGGTIADTTTDRHRMRQFVPPGSQLPGFQIPTLAPRPTTPGGLLSNMSSSNDVIIYGPVYVDARELPAGQLFAAVLKVGQNLKLTAVFSDSAGATFAMSVGLNGRLLWMRCIRYSKRNPTTLNASTDSV